MTFGEMEQRIILRLREFQGTSADDDPDTRRQYILDAADTVAQETDCLYGPRYLDIVALQSDYVDDRFYRVKRVSILRGYGGYEGLCPTNPGYWRGGGAVSEPTGIVYQGANGFALVPPALLGRTRGLLVEGFYKPGPVWKYETVDDVVTPLPIAADQECPLPAWAHECVFAHAIWQRAMDDDRAEIRSRAPRYEQAYLTQLGNVERDAATHFQNLSPVGAY